jgi:hypothetical protein
VKTILIKDYVANDKIANNIITDFSTNKYIIKGSTGIGGTSAILNIKNQNIIIISPLTGMIKSKENQSNSPHQLFIYSKSKDTWNKWMKTIENDNCIVNTTPEQIITLKREQPEIFAKILSCNFFIDEFDVLAIAEYRQSLRDFYQVIFKQIEGGIIISTATPVYKHLDIPPTVLANMDMYEFKRTNEPVKHLTIEPVNNYLNFVKQERDLGRKVILITNDFNQHKNIRMNAELSADTQTLVGDKLHTKLAKAKSHTLESDELNETATLDLTKNIFILSSKYLIGFDIQFDASIGIIADQTSDVNALTVNEIVQAYGRIRNKVLNAKLFYRSTGSDFDINQLEKEIRKVEFANNDNYLEETQPNIVNILKHITYSGMFESIMKSYGFDITFNKDHINPETQQLRFPEKYRNIVNQDEYLIHKQLKQVYSNIQGDYAEYNGFSKADLLLYSTAYLAARTGNEYMTNYPAREYERLLNAAKVFIDLNLSDTVFDTISKNKKSDIELETAKRNGALCGDNYQFAALYTEDDAFIKAIHIINHLYAIWLVREEQIDSTTRMVMRGFEIASSVVIAELKKHIEKLFGKSYSDLITNKKTVEKLNIEINSFNWHTVFNNTNRNITNELNKEFSKEMTAEIFTQILKKGDDIKASLRKNKNGIIASISSNSYSIDKQIENHSNYVLSLLSLMCSDHMFGFNTTRKDNREFNTITKCTRQLRNYTPYQMYQADITSAFATFVDQMIGSTVAKDVYANIMANNKVERSEAKKMYNSALNDATRSRQDLFKFFTSCGYTKEQTTNLVEIVKVDKGAFYRQMTIKEENAIKLFKNVNNIESPIRCHDALFWLATKEITYTTEFGNGLVFELKKI